MALSSRGNDVHNFMADQPTCTPRFLIWHENSIRVLRTSDRDDGFGRSRCENARRKGQEVTGAGGNVAYFRVLG